jgi:WS/DGAT/MGAT family acyltransferase
MSQLSALDSVFLSIETPETPGHIGGLVIMDPDTHPDGGFGFDFFVDFVAERLALCPRFAWKLQEVPFGLDEPYWVDEEELDLRRHVQAMALPSPGGTRELSQLASYLFERPLDRRLPLWEMFYIEGLQGGRVALLWKVHHCLMDGVSGAGLVELLFDLAPAPGDRPLLPVDDASSAGIEVGLLEMTSRGLRNATRRPANLARHVYRAGTQLADQLRQHGIDGVSSAPRSIFNGVVSARRSVAWSSVSFERVKQLKDELGVTVNDVVLALTSDAVRGYLHARGELPEESLVVAVPVSLREKGDKSMGNQVSEIGVAWATDIEDPLERLLFIHQAAMEAKSSDKARRVNPLQAMAESFTPGAVQLLARASGASADRMPLPANAVVSNVPMSPVPIYIGGARIETTIPMSLLAPTQGFNITVLSYCGELHFGLLADPAMVENIWEIADGVPKALGSLERAVACDARFGA